MRSLSLYHLSLPPPHALSSFTPSRARANIPIYSLSQEWLWCETWCTLESKQSAKTIDLVQRKLSIFLSNKSVLSLSLSLSLFIFFFDLAAEFGFYRVPPASARVPPDGAVIPSIALPSPP